ncbi:hypothetical protein Pmani_034305 [Petrolisthes manimaculis]|uniref:Uncharacterized protein n=1 Tax=Petrolisthes manimaculis TaxID=1843537 RepID=A0AAE1NN01_9EUCA|nr:hypothetical protein Pmani_034305 [Petrolisthes manimaculis]
MEASAGEQETIRDDVGVWRIREMEAMATECQSPPPPSPPHPPPPPSETTTETSEQKNNKTGQKNIEQQNMTQ